MSDAPQYAFKLRYVDRSSDAYYYTNWTGSSTIVVVAGTQQEAIDKAAVALGELPSHRCWTFRVLEITDTRLCEREGQGDE